MIIFPIWPDGNGSVSIGVTKDSGKDVLLELYRRGIKINLKIYDKESKDVLGRRTNWDNQDCKDITKLGKLRKILEDYHRKNINHVRVIEIEIKYKNGVTKSINNPNTWKVILVIFDSNNNPISIPLNDIDEITLTLI